MSRTKRFLYNTVSTGMLQVVNMLVGLVLPKIMLVCYGSEINGLVTSITQFISYFNLIEAGLSGAAVYALYRPLADKDHKAINGVVSAAKNFYMKSGYLFVLMTGVFAVIYPLYIKSDVITPLYIGFLVLILGVNCALEFFTLAKYRVLLTADQKTYVISIASIIQITVNTFLIILFAKLGFSIVLVRFVALFSIFLRSFILMVYCKRKYKYLNYKEEPNVRAMDKRWDALILQILGTIHTGAPVVIITVILKNLKTVSVYSIFNMVMVGLSGILGIFTSGLAASFGDVIARKEEKTLQKAYKEFEFIYYFLITVIFSVTFVTIMSFVNIYTKNITDVNYNLPVVGFMFVLNGLLFNIKTPQGMLVISAGLYKETKWQTITQGAIAVVVGSVLAPFFGIPGVLMGSILSNIYRDIDLMFFIPKNVTHLRVMDTFKRMIRIFVCVGCSMLPFFFIDYTPSTLIKWFLYAIVVAIYVVIVVGIINLIFDKEEVVNVLNRIKNMVKKDGKSV